MVRTGTQVDAVQSAELNEFARSVAQKHRGDNETIFRLSARQQKDASAAFKKALAKRRAAAGNGEALTEQILEAWPTEDDTVIPCRDPVTREVKGIIKYVGRALVPVDDVPLHFRVVKPTSEDFKHPIVNVEQNAEANRLLHHESRRLAKSHRGRLYKCGRCGSTSTSPRLQYIQAHLERNCCTGPGKAEPVAIDPIEWATLKLIREPNTAAQRVEIRKAAYARRRARVRGRSYQPAPPPTDDESGTVVANMTRE